MKVKEQAKTTVETAGRVTKNAEELLQAAAMLATSGFAYWALTQLHVPKVSYYLVLAALIVQGLRGAYELGRFLNKK